MDFTKSDALFTPSRLCRTFEEVTQDFELRPIEAMIMTFWGDNQGIIRAYAHDFGSTKAQEAIDYINASEDRKPITEKKLKSPVFNLTLFFPLKAYFEENHANPLVAQEKVYLEQRGYRIESGYYFEIPFPNGTLPSALVFLIVHDEDEAMLFSENMTSIISEVLKKFQ